MLISGRVSAWWEWTRPTSSKSATRRGSRLLAAGRGVVIQHNKDRFGVDTGLQFYLEGTKTDKKGEERTYFHASPVRVWFQFKRES